MKPKQQKQQKKNHGMLEIEGKGVITKESLQKVIAQLGEDLSEEEIEKMISVAKKVSKDKDSKDKKKVEVNFNEFVSIMNKADN